MNCIIKIIIGILITAIDMEMRIGGVQINIVSDLIGYGIVIWALKDMIPWSPCFKKSRKFAILSIITYIGLRFSLNIQTELNWRVAFIGFGTIFFIYMTYYIMEGMLVKNKMEKIYEVNQNLRGSWIIMTISIFIYCFLSITDLSVLTQEWGLPGLENLVLAIVGVICFAALIYHLMILNQNRMALQKVSEEAQESK